MNVLDNGTVIWEHCTISDNAKIGRDCVIGAYTEILAGAEIWNRCRLQGHIYIPAGVVIMSDVFIGPGVIFTNVKYPKSRPYTPKIKKTCIDTCASIGAGAIILPGVKVGAGSLVGAGAVVTKDVRPSWVVYGNPAKHIRTIEESLLPLD